MVMEQNFLSLIKIYKNPTCHIILSDKRLNGFPLKLGTRQVCLLLPILLNVVLEVLASAVSQEKEINSIGNWRGKNKTVLICR